MSTPLPRLLVLMGSGETSPTMVKVHRELLNRLGAPPVPAVMLDTPFGFQTNAAELTARAQRYFEESVGQPIEVARYRSDDEIGSAAYEAAQARLRAARYVFAGPGSPTYALRQWAPSVVPALLRDKLRAGGCVTFASAAALTVGCATVPVYEVYKVGERPRWWDGLDLLAEAGLHAAVIPHFDNAEGGTHDTRYCYLGEERLQQMEAELPDGAFVLGVDEHTGLVLDLDAATATVVGRGQLTVRARGQSHTWPADTTLTVDDLRAAAAHLADTGGGHGPPPEPAATAAHPPASGGEPPAYGSASSPLLGLVADADTAFGRALEEADVATAVQVALDLEAQLHEWGADIQQSDEMDRARGVLRAMIVRLGDLADTGARDPRDVVGPFVDAMIDARRQARSDRRFADADALRDRLVALGVEVRDTPSGTEWDLTE